MRDNAKSGALTEVTFYILLSLYTPKHGYAVMQFVEEKTGGRLSLGAGTLYGALNSLQDKKWIEPYGDTGLVKNDLHKAVFQRVGRRGLLDLAVAGLGLDAHGDGQLGNRNPEIGRASCRERV